MIGLTGLAWRGLSLLDLTRLDSAGASSIVVGGGNVPSVMDHSLRVLLALAVPRRAFTVTLFPST